MKKITVSSFTRICMLFLLISCGNSGEDIVKNNNGDSNGFISVKFNGKLKEFKFLSDSKLEDNDQLLFINGFLEDNSLSPSLELQVETPKGKITTGTYHLDENPDQLISARYTIERLEDGALVTNTTYENRDIGNKNDLIITITSLANGRAKGTFGGVITTDEEEKGDKLITLTEGTFDVQL